MVASVVVMGVAGCGKSTVGGAIAAGLGLPLIEGDHFHSADSLRKMSQGIPLDDADRDGWLARLGEQLQAHPDGAVLTCSALKRSYRERLRAASPGLRFVFLEIGREQALQRVAARENTHFFSATLVDSQFATLEPPLGEPGVLRVDALEPIERIATRALAALQAEAAR